MMHSLKGFVLRDTKNESGHGVFEIVMEISGRKSITMTFFDIFLIPHLRAQKQR